MFKISGHFDPVTNLYVAICTPILSISNREALPASNSMCFASSHRLNLQFHELSLNGQNILGYDSKENISQRTLYELLSPESLTIIGDRHKQCIRLILYYFTLISLKSHLNLMSPLLGSC